MELLLVSVITIIRLDKADISLVSKEFKPLLKLTQPSKQELHIAHSLEGGGGKAAQWPVCFPMAKDKDLL
jgi:hypothetical protein